MFNIRSQRRWWEEQRRREANFAVEDPAPTHRSIDVQVAQLAPPRVQRQAAFKDLAGFLSPPPSPPGSPQCEYAIDNFEYEC